MVLTKELEKYIEMISLDFMEATNGIEELKILEQERREEIKNVTIMLLKLYKNMPLTNEEVLLLERYSDFLMINDSMPKNLKALLFNISQYTLEKAKGMYMEQYRKECLNEVDSSVSSDSYKKYIKYIDQYSEDLSHAFVYNHDIILLDIKSKTDVRPNIDFKKQMFTEESKKKSLRKKKYNE